MVGGTRWTKLAVLGALWVTLLGSLGVGIADAVDREGHPGRGTGWLVTDVGRRDGASFWAGTHVIDDGREGFCLEFAHQGPTERIDHGYREVAAPSSLSVAHLGALGYVTSVVGSSGPDTTERRDLAAAGAYATWALAEAAGLPTASSRGVPGGAWSAWWATGMPAGSPALTALDASMDAARVRHAHELFRRGVAAVMAGGGGAVWEVSIDAAEPDSEGQTQELMIHVRIDGQGVPLIPVEVVAASGIGGVDVGRPLRTDRDGRVHLSVVRDNATDASSVEAVAWVPGAPLFFATERPIRDVTAQTMAVAGAPLPLSMRWELAGIPETTVPETTVPETMIPETMIPETTVPETTVPETTVPETMIPETTMVPETMIPETTVPETTMIPETTARSDTTLATAVVQAPAPSTTISPNTTPPSTLPRTGSGPALRQGAAAVGLLLAGWGLALQARRQARVS